MRGRKPLPTALKIAKQVRAHRINYLEPKLPEEKSPPCPKHFAKGPEGYARQHWESVVPHLAKAGLVTAVDLPALEAMCQCYAVWRENPASHGAIAEWRRLASEFGMTPCSRSRIKIGGKEVDELDVFLGGAS